MPLGRRTTPEGLSGENTAKTIILIWLGFGVYWIAIENFSGKVCVRRKVRRYVSRPWAACSISRVRTEPRLRGAGNRTGVGGAGEEFSLKFRLLLAALGTMIRIP